MGGMRNCHKSLASDNPAFDVFCLCVAVTTSSRGHRDPQASGFAGGWLLGPAACARSIEPIRCVPGNEPVAAVLVTALARFNSI